MVPNMGIFHLLEQWPASRDIPVVTTGELSWGEKQWAEVVVTDADKPPTVPRRGKPVLLYLQQKTGC